MLHLFVSTTLSLLLFLSSCVSPVYENTTYGIEEFAADSQQIQKGKFAIFAFEEKETICYPEARHLCDDLVIDGDELSVTLFCPNRPDRVHAVETINARVGFRVHEGFVSLPFLHPIEVSGLTLSEVTDRLHEAYCAELQNAKVFVNFKKRRDRFVQIIGARNTTISVDGRMRLSEVMAKAEFPIHANLFKSYVMRDGEQLPIDLYKLIHEGDNSQNIVMQGGDQIFIANATDATVMVTGEVGRPIVLPVLYGSITLREALAQAGGISFTGNKNCIQVIRGALPCPKIYVLEWKEMMLTPNQSLLLIPGDVIFITERPITQWNRFIDQLQPSTGCMQTGYNIYNAIQDAR